MVQSTPFSERQRTESAVSRSTAYTPTSDLDKNAEKEVIFDEQTEQPQLYQESRRGSAWSEAITRVNSVDLTHKDQGPKRAASPFGTIAEKAGEAEAPKREPTVLGLPDDMQPTNFPMRTKIFYLFIASIVFFNGAFGSSVASGASLQYIDELGMTKLRAASVLSLYMAGYVVAPSLWAPLSERKGRKAVNLITLPMFCLFNIGCALAKNQETLLVCRFLTGFAAAAPNSNSGGMIADMFVPAQRVWPMMAYTCAALCGPIFGPVVGGYLAQSGYWRELYWLMVGISAAIFLLCLFFQKETYVPVLLVQHAKQLRKSSGDDSHRAAQELDALNVKEVLHTHILRPVTMLFTELPCAYAAAFMSFAYGLIFLFLEGFAVTFGGIYGFSAGEVGLAFIPLALGVVASIPMVAYYNAQYMKIRITAQKPVPEARLALTKWSAAFYAVGLFWFGWTSRKEIHWIVPMLAEIPMGAGLIFAFNSLGVYTTEVYGPLFVASSLAALTIARSIFAVVCPLFGRQFFEWHVGWASSILAFIAIALSPVPFIFDRYGARIRRSSEFAFKG